MYTETAHIIYLLASMALTVFVGRTLYRNGRRFLVDAFGGDEDLADSVNHLLVVGFYLINIGYAMAAIRLGEPPRNLQSAIEYLSIKLGLVTLAVGVMHFINLGVLTRMRRNRHSFANTNAPPARTF